MNRLFFIIALLCANPVSSQQIGFNNLYGEGERLPEVITIDSTFLVFSSNLQGNSVFIRRINFQGQLTQTKTLHVDSTFFPGGDNLELLPNDSLIAYVHNAGGTPQYFMLNAQLDSLRHRAIKYQNQFTWVSSIEPVNDTSFLVTGYTFNDSLQKVYMYNALVSTELSVLWENVIDDNTSVAGGFYGINATMKNNKFYIGGWVFYPGGMRKKEAMVVCLNKNGQQLWQKRIIKDEGNSGVFVYPDPLSDHILAIGSVFTDSTRALNRQNPNQLYYGLIDTLGNLIHDTVTSVYYDLLALSTVEVSNTGSIYCGGVFNDSTGKIVAIITKLKPGGEVAWQRYFHYTYRSAFAVVDNFQLDERLTAFGQFLDNENRFSQNKDKYLWVFSVDTNGCFTADSCGGIPRTLKSSYKSTNGSLVEIYPNPSTDMITVQAQGNSAAPFKNLTLLLINSAGRKVFEKDLELEANNKAQVSLSNLPAATYLLLLISQEGALVGEQLIVKE